MLRTTLSGAVAYYEAQAPRGEYVLILEGAPEPAEPEVTLDAALARVAELQKKGLTRKDAVKQAAKELGFPKNALYSASLSE